MISSINNCIIIENNIRDIIKINEKIKNCDNLDKINIKFNPEKESEINKFLMKIKNFGKIISNQIFINDSLIIKNNDLFIEKIKTQINPNKEIISQLLYRKSKDGDSIDTFHNLCDNQGSTITLIESTEGFIIGGYTSLDWDKTSNWKSDNETFLFSLTNNKIYRKTNNKDSILCSKNYGPWFAYLGLEKKMSNGMYYSRISKNDFPFEEYNTIIPEGDKDKHFKTKEIEVYKILNE